MIDEELKREVIQDVVLLKLVGFRPIIVHGGGKEISRWVDKAGKETEFVGGLRVTDKETIEIAQMVLGKVNKDLVANVQTLGVQAAGISGMDGGMLKVEKKYVDGRDIGYVGDIKSVDTKIYMTSWSRTSCRSCIRSVWTITVMRTTLMQMKRQVPSRQH